MTTTRDPVAAVRRAWSVFRLPALQRMVDETIVELHGIEPRDLLGRELSLVDRQADHNPIAAALEACSEQLREECGVADSHDRLLLQSRQIREDMSRQPMGWTATFEEAFLKYHEAAGECLQRSFAVASPAE